MFAALAPQACALRWYSVRGSVTVLRRLFRRLMEARSSGVGQGWVYLPILDLPTCVLATEIKVLLSLRARSRREIGSGGTAAMAVSTASAKAHQFTSVVFHRARQWVTEGFGTWQLMPIVMGWWSDPGSSPTVHSALVAQVLLTMVTSGVASPHVARMTCLGSPLLKMLACLEIRQS